MEPQSEPIGCWLPRRFGLWYLSLSLKYWYLFTFWYRFEVINTDERQKLMSELDKLEVGPCFSVNYLSSYALVKQRCLNVP